MEKKLLIELFTSDLGSCLSCTYMEALAWRVIDEFRDRAEVIEYVIKDKAGMQLMKKRGIKALPALCLDGRIVYESKFPSEEALRVEILKALE